MYDLYKFIHNLYVFKFYLNLGFSNKNFSVILSMQKRISVLGDMAQRQLRRTVNPLPLGSLVRVQVSPPFNLYDLFCLQERFFINKV